MDEPKNCELSEEDIHKICDNSLLNVLLND